MLPTLDLLFPETHNLKTLGVVDISKYPPGFNITLPTLEVQPPNLPRVQLKFSVNSLNLYNSGILNITCDSDGLLDLPDGVWNVKYTIAPAYVNFVEKTFLRVNVLQHKFDKLFLCIDLGVCDEKVKEQDMEKIDEIEFLINGAVAAANNCNNYLAMKLYNMADMMIDTFYKDKNVNNVLQHY